MLSSFHRRTVVPLLAAGTVLLLALPGHVASAATSGAPAAPPAASAATSPVPRIAARALRPGARGRDVRALQQLLGRSGVPVAVSGRYRYATARAVQRFQLAAVLPTSGIAGPRTIARLRQSARRPVATAASGGVGFGTHAVAARRLGDRLPLARGMSGRDVRQLQSFLRRIGVRGTPRPSGEFGRATVAAVRRFEHRIGRRGDGVVDAGEVYRLVRLVGDSARPGADGVQLGALPLAPGDKATIGPDGLAVAPEDAPEAVRRIIAAGNRIATKPYIFGGGHGSFQAAGYDCSGSVSFALHGGGLISRPLASYDYFDWGRPGAGSWVTIYTNSGHMFMVVAGLRFDTSGAGAGRSRWQRDLRDTSAYRVRHPAGL